MNETTTLNFSIRLPTDLVERIERISEDHPNQVRAPGGTGRASRARVIRILLERAVSEIERAAKS